MTYNRRPISLLVSVALGIGAALLVLLGGGRPAAAAPANVGDSKPAPAAGCHARDDSATGTFYNSADSAAVRQAVAAAIPNDIVRLAGTCAGVAPGGGTSQTVAITQVLNLVGGYTPADWVHSFPLTQPTTLDAQGLGRVITASADITIAELTVQNGNSFGHNGGGIFAGGKLTMLGVVNLLSNTAQVGTSVKGPMTPNVVSGGFGGGAFGSSSIYVDCHDPVLATHPQCLQAALIQANKAVSGGGLFGQDVVLHFVTFDSNMAAPYAYGGGVDAVVSLQVANSTFSYNSAGVGGGIGGYASMDIQHTNILHNVGVLNGGGGFSYSNPMILKFDVVDFNTAPTASAWQFYANNATLDSNRFENNRSGPAGSTVAFTDGTANVFNTVVAGNTTNGGTVVASSTGNGGADFDFGESTPSEVDFHDFLEAVDMSGLRQFAGSTNPAGSSVVNTATAVSVSGVTLFITDTIISGYGTDLATDNSPSSTIVGDYNLFAQTPVITGTGITTGTHSLVGNPMFADALGHLSAGSPAIDHGINVGINVDLDGNHRPSGAGFDIGAYEFQFAMAKLFLPLVRR